MDHYRSFRDFYPDYLAEHRNPVSRRLHFFGTLLVLGTLVFAIATGRWLWLLALPLFGYGFAWLGHFAFERNRPGHVQASALQSRRRLRDVP